MLTYAVFSDKGDRPYNEDSTYAVATENEGCFALADGLGGQGKGDVASKFVVEEVKKKYDQKRKKCLEKFITDMVSECQREFDGSKRTGRYNRRYDDDISCFACR